MLEQREGDWKEIPLGELSIIHIHHLHQTFICEVERSGLVGVGVGKNGAAG